MEGGGRGKWRGVVLRSATRLASASESSCAALGGLQAFNCNDLRGDDALQDELGNPVGRLYGKVRIAVVEEQHLDRPAVVCVNHAGARVKKVLAGEPAAGRDAAVGVWGHCNREIRVHEGLAACRDRGIFSAVISNGGLKEYA